MAARNFSNTTTVGTLNTGVGSGDTSLVVDDFSGNPTAPFTITIGRNTDAEEVCLVTAVIGSTLTVTRGYNGVAAQAHSAGATVEHTAIALDFSEANSHVNASTSVHGITGSVVGTEGSQILADKNLISPVLSADVTDGDAVVLEIPSGAEARNLLRGVDSGGNDVIVITSDGELQVVDQHLTGDLEVDGTAVIDGVLDVNGASTLQSVSGTTANFSGAVTVGGSASLSNGLTVTGAITATGTVSGATPTTNAHLTTKAYADALGTESNTASTIVRRTSGTAINVGTANVSSVNSSGTISGTAISGTTGTFSGALSATTGSFSGAVTAATTPTNTNHLTNKGYVDGLTEFKCGTTSITTNGSGDFTITHGLGTTPTGFFIVSRTLSANDAHVFIVNTLSSTNATARAFWGGAAQASTTLSVTWFAVVGN